VTEHGENSCMVDQNDDTVTFKYNDQTANITNSDEALFLQNRSFDRNKIVIQN